MRAEELWYELFWINGVGGKRSQDIASAQGRQLEYTKADVAPDRSQSVAECRRGPDSGSAGDADRHPVGW